MSIAIAFMTGGLGCACVGAAGLFGMLFGLVLTTSPALIARANT